MPRIAGYIFAVTIAEAFCRGGTLCQTQSLFKFVRRFLEMELIARRVTIERSFLW